VLPANSVTTELKLESPAEGSFRPSKETESVNGNRFLEMETSFRPSA
jgi:hypothetical protein